MKKTINVGSMVAGYIAENNISKAALSRALKVSPPGIEYRMKRSTYPTAFLLDLCHELRYNFFTDIAGQLPASYASKAIPDTEKDEEIRLLKQEIIFLNREKDLLTSLLKEPSKE